MGVSLQISRLARTETHSQQGRPQAHPPLCWWVPASESQKPSATNSCWFTTTTIYELRTLLSKPHRAYETFGNALLRWMFPKKHLVISLRSRYRKGSAASG